LRRFFVKVLPDDGGPCIIDGKEARHIIKVLRMGKGDRVIVMDPAGQRYYGVIESLGTQSVALRLEGPAPRPEPSPIEIELCQALLKSQAMDLLVQKASEIGVDKLVPFTSERTVVKLDQERFGLKRRHWQEIARNAAKQCDRASPMEIAPLQTFQDLVFAMGDIQGQKVILWEQEPARDLRGLLRSTSSGGKVIAIVGPEGGFSGKEVEIARGSGFVPASLGSRILRSETAALAISAILQYEWGDLGG